MSREIDLEKDKHTEEDRAYLLQRPWLISDEQQQELRSQEQKEDEYRGMSKKKLRVELKRRDLDYSDATKDELIQRLQMAEQQEEAQLPPDPRSGEEDNEE